MLRWILRILMGGRLSKAFMRGYGLNWRQAREMLEKRALKVMFETDLVCCRCKNPSVIKRDFWQDGKVRRVWEMYHSSNHLVYVYIVPSGERRKYS